MNPTGFQALASGVFKPGMSCWYLVHGITKSSMDVSKNRGTVPPKWMGENHGKPYEQMDDLGKTHYFRTHPYK